MKHCDIGTIGTGKSEKMEGYGGRTRTRSAVVLLLLCAPFILHAQQSPAPDNMGIAVIVGKSHAWMLEAPEDWILDPQGAAAAGLGAAFYPTDQTWGSAPAVMYANAIVKSADSITVDHVIKDEMRRAAARLPKTEAREVEPIPTIQGVDARVCHFMKSDSSLFEAVAYIDCPTVVALVVLSARNARDFRASLGAFARLVDSYEWITNDPSRIKR